MDGRLLRPGRPLVVVTGPTGSGKSELSLQLAARFRGEIVNCDSVQVYRFFDLGSAKLSVPERRGISHRLIDIVDPDQPFTAGDYSRLARTAIEEISGRGGLPIVTGGTGFYIRALLDGLFESPSTDAALRIRLTAREQRRPGSLHRLLRRLDPAAAGRIHHNDVNKTTRALEVRLSTGRPMTSLHETGRDGLEGYTVCKLILNPLRKELCSKLDERLARMFEQGLIEETRKILNRGYGSALKPFESLGYRQAVQFLKGELTEKEALTQAQIQTRQYAKRQITWFRREKDAVWLDGFGSDPSIEQAAIEHVAQLISG